MGKPNEGGRLHLLDALRGFSIISMVLFHFCYDLRFIRGVQLLWFSPPFIDIWRASISWTFLSIAGCTCALSHDNLRRSVRYGALACGIYLATKFASVDAPISFGIIYCMAACTFVFWLLDRLHLAPKGPRAALILFACFLLLLHLGSRRIGIGPFMLEVPAAPYESDVLSWLGFPGPTFVSGDYYPLLPYLCLYLAGAAMGCWWKERGFPEAFSTVGCPPLELIGQHPLIIYVLHQPLLLGLAQLFG